MTSQQKGHFASNVTQGTGEVGGGEVGGGNDFHNDIFTPDVLLMGSRDFSD